MSDKNNWFNKWWNWDDELYEDPKIRRKKQLEEKKKIYANDRKIIKYWLMPTSWIKAYSDWFKTRRTPFLLPWQVLEVLTALVMLVLYIWISKQSWDMLWLYKAADLIMGAIFLWFWYYYDLQHKQADITRCPKCDSEDIKYARHGYDWGQAWTWETLGIPEGKYTAGMRYNYTDCHCCKCGYTWTVNVDYRFL